MDWNIIEARWHEFRARAKQEWDKLSEQQLRGTGGRRDYIVMRVQEAYGLTREEAEQRVSEWQARQYDRLAPAANGP